MIALDPNGTFPFIVESDRKLPVADRTTFHIRALTEAERDELVRIATLSERGDPNWSPAKVMRIILTVGIDGWENLRRADGSLVDPVMEPATTHPVRGGRRPNYLSSDSLRSIPACFWPELMSEVLNQASIGARRGEGEDVEGN